MGADRKLVADFVYQKSFLANFGVRFLSRTWCQKKGKEENQEANYNDWTVDQKLEMEGTYCFNMVCFDVV